MVSQDRDQSYDIRKLLKHKTFNGRNDQENLVWQCFMNFVQNFFENHKSESGIRVS